MNLGIKGFFSKINFFSQSYVPVRHRYYAEKLAKGPTVNKFGYKDKIFKSGPLGRLKDAEPLKVEPYKPGNNWTKEKCTFGQNDYIDILGGYKIKPQDVCYNVPKWLRGRNGNERKLLLMKYNMHAYTNFEYENPHRWDLIRKRLRHLYNYYNNKTEYKFMRD